MSELKIDVLLNSDLVREYYHSEKVYKAHIHSSDKQGIYIGSALLILSFAVGYYYFEKLFVLVIAMFFVAIYNFWKYSKIFFLKRRWLKAVEATASTYNGVSSAQLVINNDGIT